MDYRQVILRLGVLGCLMLVCGCVKTVKGQYYNIQANHYYYADQKAQAFELYHQSARNGVADAQYMVAQMLLYSDGVTGNASEGMQWLEKAAAQDHVEADRDLGLYLLAGDFAREQDTRQAVQFLERAAGGGDSLSMLTLGYLYCSGYGVPRNPHTAAYWYSQAAEHGESIPVQWQEAEYLSGLAAPPAFDASAERRARIKRAQTGLKALGYYKSAVDGIAGPGTAGAVKKFQKDQQLEVTGRIDVALMRHLYRHIVFDPMNRLM